MLETVGAASRTGDVGADRAEAPADGRQGETVARRPACPRRVPLTTMVTALRVAWFTVRVLYSDMFLLVGASLLWFALNLPCWVASAVMALGLTSLVNGSFGVDLPDSVIVGASLLLVTIGPTPASVAIGHLTAPLAREELFEFRVVWDSLRRDWPRAACLWLIAQVGFALLVANVVFYWSSDQLALRAIGALFAWATVFWFAMQFFVAPLRVEQGDRPLRNVLRNAAVVTVAHPLLAFGLVLVAVVGVALAVVLALVTPLLLGAFISLMGARAVAELKWRYFPDEAPLAADELEGA